MNFWEFRRLVRANLDKVGPQQRGLGCPLCVLFSGRPQDYNPDPHEASELAQLDLNTCCGIADGWDCNGLDTAEFTDLRGTPGYERGRRYGARMYRVFGGNQ